MCCILAQVCAGWMLRVSGACVCLAASAAATAAATAAAAADNEV
jgi:hypothetical protein